MGNYLYLPIIALIFYSFLLCAFIGYRKTRIIRLFIYIIETNIFWTLGSVLMRSQVAGLFEVWYHISLFGILALPYALYDFIACYVEERKTLQAKIAGIIIYPIYIINVFTGVFLASPEIVINNSGSTAFVYTPSAMVIILFVPAIVLFIECIRLFVTIGKEEMNTVRKLIPIMCGAAVLLIGNLLIMLPIFDGIPLDILSCNINAIFLFYVLYKKRLFKLSALFSTMNRVLLAIISTLMLYWGSFDSISLIIDERISTNGDVDIVLIIMLFLFTMGIVYLVINKVLNSIFVKDEIKQTELLKEFSMKVSRSLEKDDILEELLNVIKETLGVKKIYIFLPRPADSKFDIVKSGNPLYNKQFILSNDNPIIKYIKSNLDIVYIKDFSRTLAYKGLWEIEKENIREFGLEYIAPLHNEDELIGFVALAKKEEKKESYSLDDLSFLSSISSVASIALKNSIMYEKACYEARTDELTGLYNRKYFLSVLEEKYEECQNKTLTLAILNIDDFKLYNQLYGNQEGDIALKNIAKLIKSTVGEKGFVARYSGKEFAVLLPLYDTLSAKELTEHICGKIANVNFNAKDYSMKCLTVSAGICSIPYGASNTKQLLTNVDMAVYQVKRNGKNAITVYSEGVMNWNKSDKADKKEDAYASYASTIYALTAAIDTKDHYTFQHSNNVAYYSTELARAYGLSEDSIEIVYEAALLHDIGKIGIPEDVLNKPGKLTDEEYIIMKTHVENSIGIIRHLPSLDYVIPAVIGHHERYDGQGYPRRIGGEDIPLSARILCIADSFDAMISKRSYKNAMPVEKGLSIIEEELSKQFDPILGDLFVQLVREKKITPRINEQVEG